VQESTVSPIPSSSAGVDTDAKHTNPRDSRRLPLAVFAGFVVAAILVALPQAIEPWGHSGGFGAIVGISILCVPFLFWLPILPESAAASRGLLGRRLMGITTLASMFLFSVGQGAIWAFSERIGITIGFSREGVGLALGVTTLMGLAGGVIAAVLILPVARAVDRLS
jgi:hypothetical protein